MCCIPTLYILYIAARAFKQTLTHSHTHTLTQTFHLSCPNPPHQLVRVMVLLVRVMVPFWPAPVQLRPIPVCHALIRTCRYRYRYEYTYAQTHEHTHAHTCKHTHTRTRSDVNAIKYFFLVKNILHRSDGNPKKSSNRIGTLLSLSVLIVKHFQY